MYRKAAWAPVTNSFHLSNFREAWRGKTVTISNLAKKQKQKKKKKTVKSERNLLFLFPVLSISCLLQIWSCDRYELTHYTHYLLFSWFPSLPLKVSIPLVEQLSLIWLQDAKLSAKSLVLISFREQILLSSHLRHCRIFGVELVQMCFFLRQI